MLTCISIVLIVLSMSNLKQDIEIPIKTPRSQTNTGKNIFKKIFLLFVFLSLIPLFFSQLCAAQPGDGPNIHITETNHTFPTVFEGEKLTHTFRVFNKGNADLNIKRVTPS